MIFDFFCFYFSGNVLVNRSRALNFISSPTMMSPAAFLPFHVSPKSLRLTLPETANPALVSPPSLTEVPSNSTSADE